MSNITKNHKAGIFAIFLASALLMGTISVTGIDSALATKNKDHHDDKSKDKSKDRDHDKSKDSKRSGNDAEQKIEQENKIKNDSFCVDASTVSPTLSCNNIGVGLNLNTGNIAGGQD